MGIESYRAKRNFKSTPEPPGSAAAAPQGFPSFVVQRHESRRLHFDFRLEHNGALKSWAVPKGPSLDPRDRRLAVMVEDHPVEYRSFEGNIPAGEYGAGEVEIWDKGAYASRSAKSPEESARQIEEGLRRGHVAFVLYGERLKGEFALVKMNGGEENAWLLIKAQDEYALGQKSARGTIRPMLARLAQAPFDREGWIFEPKWDGYRAIAEIRGGRAELHSRNGLPLGEKFRAVAESLSEIADDCVIDGEVIAIKGGRPDFQSLQDAGPRADLGYAAFDLPYLGGESLESLPLIERKRRLRELIPLESKRIFYVEHSEGRGREFFERAVQEGMEGIMAKNGASPYREGVRSPDWLKIKRKREQDAVIIGYTDSEAPSRRFGSLALAFYARGKLTYAGHSGGGFREGEAEELLRLLAQIPSAPYPVSGSELIGKLNWVEPRYVCRIEFAEWTEDGLMRHPAYKGLRPDKPPEEAQKEAPESAMFPFTDKFSNLDKVFWPEEGYSKGDLIAYYDRISEFILPYLIGRPENLNRHPDGIAGTGFYHKNVTGDLPPYVRTAEVYPEKGGKAIRQVVCDNKETLLYLANLGCIELNPWSSRAESPDRPDYMILDLDPHGRPFADLVAVALELKRILDVSCGRHFIKTSGKTGLHIAIPLAARYDYATIRTFGELLAKIAHEHLPDTTSVERNPEKRRGLIYLDYLQNRRGQTIASAYSLRPYPGATASAPLEWDEVGPKLDPSLFNIRTMEKRLKEKGDLWKGVLGQGVDLLEAIKRLESDFRP